MKLAFPLPHLLELKATMQPWELAVDGAEQRRMARRAEELGYDMLAVPEHFLIPRSHVELSGGHYFHAAAAQGFLAGATERIRINSCIALLPLQHPAITAKALSTVDWLSGGRMIATFGVGWLEEEFKMLNVPFRERGRMADEYVAAIIELWTSDNPSFEGRYVNFSDVVFEPKPLQKPHLPIWMGGDSDAALKRTARFASGWWPFLTPPDKLAERIAFIKSQPDFRGEPFEVMYGLATARVGEGHVVNDDPALHARQSQQQLVDGLSELRDMGVTMSSVPIPPVADGEAYLDYAQWVIEEVKPRL